MLVTPMALHAAANPVVLQAPFVLSFASWLGSLIGAILLHTGTRPLVRGGHPMAPMMARTFLPLLATVLAALTGVLVVAWLGNAWTAFWELWVFRWLAMAASMAVFTALFSLLGFFALLAVPLVFYQTLPAGLLAPPAAAPDWLRWLDLAPLHQSSVGLRALLIGGPPDAVPWIALGIVLAGAIAVTWLGTLVGAAAARCRR
ncbi:MAG: hypothetical protein FJX64_03325 [Alphaproteobacteria bacterium]|nr:hypothetical protein [Alphaproteobacteria bacterium]